MNKNKTTHPKHVLDNRANQLNPQHTQYYRSRGIDPLLAERLAERREKPEPNPDEFRRQFQKNSQPK